MSAKRALAFAYAWGLAEATCFFFVPDVYLTFLALRKPRLAFKASGAALAGALSGGALMYWWGLHAPATALSFLRHVPAIHTPMIAQVREQLEARGLAAVLLGPLQGTPYKIYAVQWGVLHAGVGGFLLVSIPARLIRFVASVLVALALRKWVVPWGLACAWIAFYLFYFWRFGW